MSSEYTILDEGALAGTIRQEGQSALRKVLRAVSNIDQLLTHTLSVSDADGTKVLELTRPRKVFKSKVLVRDGQGADAGSIVQQNMLGKIRFDLVSAVGERLGAIHAENWRAWDFAMLDAEGGEVGRITKKWAGVGREMFTTADNYMVEISPSVEGPLRLLMVGAAASVDLALKQSEA